MINEKSTSAPSGYLFVLIQLATIAGCVLSMVLLHSAPLFIVLLLASILMLPGFFIVNPNESKVLVLFGEYNGTVKSHGFYWANPFFKKTNISLKARNFDTEKIKVNDNLGNPIIISAVVVWKVENTAKAAFEVNDYRNYVLVQSDAALRYMAGKYPYDCFEDEGKESGLTLRGGGEEVNDELENALRERLAMAGINVLDARINHLAYAEEIAGAMLQRQQATAIVAARHKIVEGAVGMVDMAIEHLERDNIIHLDDERKAAMVSNLMVVLCSDKNASPVVNTGSLY